MNNEPSTSAPQTEPTPPQTSMPTLGNQDDLDFGDSQLGVRQEDANEGIVCEGGCQ